MNNFPKILAATLIHLLLGASAFAGAEQCSANGQKCTDDFGNPDGKCFQLRSGWVCMNSTNGLPNSLAQNASSSFGHKRCEPQEFLVACTKAGTRDETLRGVCMEGRCLADFLLEDQTRRDEICLKKYEECAKEGRGHHNCQPGYYNCIGKPAPAGRVNGIPSGR